MSFVESSLLMVQSCKLTFSFLCVVWLNLSVISAKKNRTLSINLTQMALDSKWIVILVGDYDRHGIFYSYNSHSTPTSFLLKNKTQWLCSFSDLFSLISAHS